MRLGITKTWESHWYGGKDYSDKIVEDQKIRTYILKRIPKGAIAKVIIERTLKRLVVTIKTGRPGIVIGKGGAEVEALKQELKRLTKKDVQVNIYEVKRPELDATLIADNIAQQLRARISFRRAMKSAVAAAMRMGAEGIKIQLSGILGNAEMSRTEMRKEGRIPLQTLRADIDYALGVAQTTAGLTGIKVWVFKGELFGKVDLSPEAMHNAMSRGNKSGGGAGGGGRRGGAPGGPGAGGPGSGPGGDDRPRRRRRNNA